MTIIGITGSTGFLGSELLKNLCAMDDISTIIAYISDSPSLSSQEKLDRVMAHWEPSPQCYPSKIKVVPLRLGHAYSNEHAEYPYQFKFFFHLAGLTDLNPPLETARRNNVFSTQQALRIAQRSSDLERFVHLSTAYVCGKHDETIIEDMQLPLSFHNDYERTKFEAETAVRRSQIPYTIIRPSIIVGRRSDGYYPQTKVIYSLWKAWLRGIAPRIPVDRDSYVDLVPLDWVCSVIWELCINPAALNGTFHACAGEHRQNNHCLIEMASRIFEMSAPKTCPQFVLDFIKRPLIKNFVPYDLKKLIDEFSQLLIYMNSKKRVFCMKKTDTILAKKNLLLDPFSEWGEVIFKYCRQSVWGKKHISRKVELDTSEGNIKRV